MYNQIFVLKKALESKGIPFEFAESFELGGYGLVYPSRNQFVCSVIEHDYSYGHEQDLLEIMGLTDDEPYDDVVGYLTAEDVFQRIYRHYKTTLKEGHNHD